jgi:hypothetical protein
MPIEYWKNRKEKAFAPPNIRIYRLSSEFAAAVGRMGLSLDDDGFEKVDDSDNLDHDDVDHDALNRVHLAVEPKEGESITNCMYFKSLLLYILRVENYFIHFQLYSKEDVTANVTPFGI